MLTGDGVVINDQNTQFMGHDIRATGIGALAFGLTQGHCYDEGRSDTFLALYLDAPFIISTILLVIGIPRPVLPYLLVDEASS